MVEGHSSPIRKAVRAAARPAWRLLTLYWRVRGPITVGVRVLVTNDRDQVLLCRHTYGPSALQLPGGRVTAGETLPESAVRELQEETGLVIRPVDLGLLGVYTNFRYGKNDHIVVFNARVEAVPVSTRSVEIAEAAFLDLDALPDDVSPGTSRRIAEFNGHVPVDYRW